MMELPTWLKNGHELNLLDRLTLTSINTNPSSQCLSFLDTVLFSYASIGVLHLNKKKKNTLPVRFLCNNNIAFFSPISLQTRWKSAEAHGWENASKIKGKSIGQKNQLEHFASVVVQMLMLHTWRTRKSVLVIDSRRSLPSTSNPARAPPWNKWWIHCHSAW